MCGQVVRTAELLPGRSQFMDQQAPQWGKLNVNRFNQAKDKSDMSVKLSELLSLPASQSLPIPRFIPALIITGAILESLADDWFGW